MAAFIKHLALSMAPNNAPPILYSYSRCPYAMRARMALVSAGVQCEVHEIDFKKKPAAMLAISPKGTVPVLHLAESAVIEESLDIMRWALAQNDPQNWMVADEALIAENDGAFKAALDRYKYPNRFPEEDCSNARAQALAFLEKLNALLETQNHLSGDDVGVVDIAIFPFVRQCANVDRAWFDDLPLAALQKWLAGHLASDLFKHIMKKHKASPHSLL